MEQSSSLLLALSVVEVRLMGQNKLICQNSSFIVGGCFLLIYVQMPSGRQFLNSSSKINCVRSSFVSAF